MAKQMDGKNFKVEDQLPNQKYLVQLKIGKPTASGKTQYGSWNLWIMTVTNAKVTEKISKAVVPDFTGEAAMFADDDLSKEIMKLTNGTQENVKVLFSWHPEISDKGKPYKKVEVELSESGKTPAVAIGFINDKLLSDFVKYVDNKILDETKEAFTSVAKGPVYKVPEDKIDQMWAVYLERKKK